MTALATRATEQQWSVMEKVVVQGDLSKLQPDERVAYYRAVCESVGLNPLTQPFAYITLNGKLTLYALKGATDQLRHTRGITVVIVSRERLDDLYVVTARATLPSGRHDESIGAVTIAGLKGEALANALMKAETKAKRRVTLSVVGLGMLDESETAGLAHAVTVPWEPDDDDDDGGQRGGSPRPPVDDEQPVFHIVTGDAATFGPGGFDTGDMPPDDATVEFRLLLERVEACGARGTPDDWDALTGDIEAATEWITAEQRDELRAAYRETQRAMRAKYPK